MISVEGFDSSRRQRVIRNGVAALSTFLLVPLCSAQLPFDLSSPVITPMPSPGGLPQPAGVPSHTPTATNSFLIKPSLTPTPLSASGTARATAIQPFQTAAGYAYRAPSNTQGAFAVPSFSGLGYAQFQIVLTDLDVSPCRGAEWLMGSGAGVALRFTLAKLAGLPAPRFGLAAAEDGGWSVRDGSPSLVWVNYAGAAPLVMNRAACAPSMSGRSASPSAGASRSPYAWGGDGSRTLTITVRLFGNGTAASVAAAAAAVRSLDPSLLATRFRVSSQAAFASLALDTAPGALLQVMPLAVAGAGGGSGGGGLTGTLAGDAVVLSPGALAGVVVGCVVGVLLLAGSLLLVYRAVARAPPPEDPAAAAAARRRARAGTGSGGGEGTLKHFSSESSPRSQDVPEAEDVPGGPPGAAAARRSPRTGGPPHGRHASSSTTTDGSASVYSYE